MATTTTRAPGAQRTGRTQADRSATTRAALVRAARELFADQGFAATSRDEIAERAGVTRGALYHHFESKSALAAAVVAELENELVERVVVAAAEGDGVREELHLGCRAYMDASADPTISRILAEAPAVLGVAACRALDAEACMPLLENGFARAKAEGIEVPGDPAVAAALLLGLLNEAAGLIAAAPFNRARREAVAATVDVFLTKLFG
ncbi:MAG TPA: helix-turn-helix domain-containing protein [Acidimicrobiales bacterium]|jgi:AcrR family transcriptional regulator|nr:helix-turn-helix domain-containing protein [Acidimicrobiales bacterium]